MPPPSASSAFHLSRFPTTVYVYQIPKDQTIPQRLLDALADPTSKLTSITRTIHELSVVTDIELDESLVPGLKAEDWACYTMLGPMAFDLVGVINNFTSPLKAAGVGVFVVSTWNTDLVLIPAQKEQEARAALEKDGWIFVN